MNSWLQDLRYGIAVFTVAIVPLILVYWYLIHSLTRLWRWIGVRGTFAIAGTLCLAAFWTTVHFRQLHMTAVWPFHWMLVMIGVALLAVAYKIEKECHRLLALRVMVGIPEFGDQEWENTTLLTQGIYSRTRNPRYLAILLGMLGIALMVQFPAVYLAWVVIVPGTYLLILLEERELKGRFGQEYRRYLNDVPRLILRAQRSHDPGDRGQ